MANENLVSATITRDSEVQDAGGGFTDGEPVTVYSGPAKLFPAMLRSSEKRDEADPGISTTSLRYMSLPKPVAFTAPATEVLPSDKVVVGTDRYTVSAIWDYHFSVQIEMWRLH
jgi:hypothetical protein